MYPDICTDRFRGYTFDCDMYCGGCLPVDKDDENVGVISSAESFDSPPHCSFCCRPLRGDLSKDGIATVLEWAREDLREEADDREDMIDLTSIDPDRYAAYWYRGSRMPAIARDWALWLVQNGCVSGRDKRFLELFLWYTRPRTRLELAMLRLPTVLRPHVSEDGTFHASVFPGGYPLTYYSGDYQEQYCPTCAQQIHLDATGKDRPIQHADIIWELDDDHGPALDTDTEGDAPWWPTCDECGENLEVAYPPDGYTPKGEKEG